jgi:hypothetical protein
VVSYLQEKVTEGNASEILTNLSSLDPRFVGLRRIYWRITTAFSKARSVVVFRPKADPRLLPFDPEDEGSIFYEKSVIIYQ